MDAAARERTNASAEAALGFRQQLLPLLLPPRAACGGILATHGGTNSGPSHFRQKNTAGLRLEPASDENQTDVEYDEASKTVRIPLSAMDGGRRTKLVMFTCNKCGELRAGCGTRVLSRTSSLRERGREQQTSAAHRLRWRTGQAAF
jgi:hypothetical protein